MIQAVGAGGTATYTYNGDGLKIQRVGPDGTTHYYDGIRPIWETDGVGVMTAQLDRDIFGNLLSRREASGTRRYYHPDGLGSTIALTDEAGGVATSMLHDAWGNVRANTGAGHGRYRFTGAELDEASGLYHMGARFYDPTIGRWLSEDPLQSSFEPMSLNFYAYVANNPLVLIDPTGMMPTGPEGGGCGGDLDCLNEERQREVRDLLERLRIVAGNSQAAISDVDLIRWAGFLLAAAVMAADAAAPHMPEWMLRANIKGLYIESYVFIGIGMSAETLRFFFTSPAELKRFVWDVATNPATEIGVGLFAVGAYLDMKYFNGDVWREFCGSFCRRGY